MKVTLKWSEKQQDFIVRYPEMPNRNGRITGSFFCHITEMAEDYAKKIGYESLKDYFSKGGFDINTFRITIELKEQ